MPGIDYNPFFRSFPVRPFLELLERFTMRDMSSRFIEILNTDDSNPRMSDSDVRLEDVLADHEANVNRRRSSTQSSGSKLSFKMRTSERENTSLPSQRLKRLSNILRRDGKDE